MIDTHAHVLPGLDTVVRGGGPPHNLVARAANRMIPSRSPLEIGTVATLESRLPARGFSLVEQVATVASLPVLVAGGNVAGLLSSMDRHCLTRTVIIGSRGPMSNDWLFERAWPQARERLIPVACIPDLPTGEATVDQWVDAYRELADRGAAGFKIHPNWDGVKPGHAVYDAAFEVASEYDKFIIVHTGCFHVRTYRDLEPLLLTDLKPYFERFPEVRVCLAHMNRAHPEEVWELQREYDQVYTDTSWQPAPVIKRAIGAVGSDRLLLGSDWPLLHLSLQRDAIRTAERAASGRDFDNIVLDAPRRFLGAAV